MVWDLPTFQNPWGLRWQNQLLWSLVGASQPSQLLVLLGEPYHCLLCPWVCNLQWSHGSLRKLQVCVIREHLFYISGTATAQGTLWLSGLLRCKIPVVCVSGCLSCTGRLLLLLLLLRSEVEAGIPFPFLGNQFAARLTVSITALHLEITLILEKCRLGCGQLWVSNCEEVCSSTVTITGSPAGSSIL